MELFKKEEVQAKRHNQTRELILKNEKLISSLKKTLALQKDIEFDAEKAKKVKDYMQWCEDLQKKQSKELANFEAYKKLTEDKKDEYYRLVESKDALEDKIVNLKEDVEKLKLQVEWNQKIIEKQKNALIHSKT